MGAISKRRFYVVRYELVEGASDSSHRRRCVEGPYTHRDARKVAKRYHQSGFTHGLLGIAVGGPDGPEFMPRFPGVPAFPLDRAAVGDGEGAA